MTNKTKLPKHNQIKVQWYKACISGPRHGGRTMDRTVVILINGFVYQRHTERSNTIDWAYGKRFDEKISSIVNAMETMLFCKAEHIQEDKAYGAAA